MERKLNWFWLRFTGELYLKIFNLAVKFLKRFKSWKNGDNRLKEWLYFKVDEWVWREQLKIWGFEDYIK